MSAETTATSEVRSGRPAVVIVGAGFGGLFAARRLARADVDIVIIDRHNYHLFQPLLYQVATAGLAPSDIAWPVRSILTRQRNARVLLGEVGGVDTDSREVIVGARRIPYDWLIVATGSVDGYFSHDDWAEWAPGLKSVDDATSLRRRLLLAFERAETEADAARREQLLRFVVIGGGPTGVELAGAIAELAHYTLARDFRRIDPRRAEVVLVEGGDRLLSAFTPTLSDYAKRALEKLGVSVRLGRHVTDVDADGIAIDDERIAAATVLWAAGVKATPVADWLGVAADRQGRVTVDERLRVPELDQVFIFGDAACVEMPDGSPVPGIAPAAKQQGRYVADVIRAAAESRSPPPPFRYRHGGHLATIGRRAAVAEFGRLRLKGWLAWWLWGIAHIYFLIGLSSPLIVSIRWLWQYLTYGRGARLITGTVGDERPDSEEVDNVKSGLHKPSRMSDA